MNKNKKKFFIGVDLGWREKKTTGICVLEEEKLLLMKDVKGKNLLKEISSFLDKTSVIAVDAPLTQGKGKGKMRLYEKFLSTAVFRKEKVNPVPPILMPEFHKFALEIVKGLEEKGFVLGLNLIEVFPGLIKKICRADFISKNIDLKTENEESSMLCVKTAFLHLQGKTRWLGYKDGFLFLPETSFWKKEWQEKFYLAWKERPYLKYRYLTTNLFK